MRFESIAEVRSWAEFNNYVLGTPMLHRATFKIEHVDGTALNVDELQALQPTSSEALYEERLRKAGLPVSSLNAGVLNVIFTKLRERQQ